MKFISTFLLVIGTFFSVIAQDRTVGLLSYQPWSAFDGYNLIYPHNQPNTYLLNNCGEVVHVWEGAADWRPGNTAYIMPDGNLVRTRRPAAVAGNPIWAGGGGGTIELLDWDGNILWEYTKNDEFERFHHDIAITGEGTILAITWELKTSEEAIAAGRDTALLAQQELWPDKIIEIDPSTDEIIWEWNVWDHLIQDYDATKANFGVVADHPELVDLNWDTNEAKADWMHTNAIDYNAERDQIMLSVPTFHEVWIIDHTTTTEEAAGHFGGQANRGGDLLYRWGNPATYDAGTVENQQLFYQHDAHWAEQFVAPTHPHYGKIMVFNNRVGTDFSTVNIFDPEWDMYKWQYAFEEGTFAPNDFDFTYTHPDAGMMHSTGLSSFQLLPNGNYLIDVGRYGYSFEITPNTQEIVWEYKTPIAGGAFVSQGDTLEINNNLTFRMTRYPTDFTAFDGKDLTPQGYLELNPDEGYCLQVLPANEVFDDYALLIYPNPADDMITMEWKAGRYTEVKIYDLYGRLINEFMASGGRKYVDTSDWLSGIYVVQVDGVIAQKVMVK